ncbi:Aste57867_12564 [Aphanomyces stellatus]|uniref:Aste57867_12564 protein n=1 Tax=Aphanomyces stellatus TaxID=120398 RepID=A0A485KW99_9STRA|nr:hypothetical protein As57867_012518 [Aphanomyces stellatus]VFT89415.1 Aste57867_12564 [Aphanomyces stellatus]
MCRYIDWTAKAIQTYNQTTSQFEIVDRECNVMPNTTNFQAVGDIHFYPGQRLSYVNRPELVDLEHAIFPKSLGSLELQNVGLRSMSMLRQSNEGFGNSTAWPIALEHLYLTDMSIDELPATMPRHKLDLKLRNVSIANMASFGSIRPINLEIKLVKNLLLQNVDFATLQTWLATSFESTTVESISNVQFKDAITLIWTNCSIRNIANVEIRDLRFVVLSNVHISNWTMDTKTFTVMSALSPSFIFYENGGSKLSPGWKTSNTSFVYDKTLCEKQRGTTELLWSQANLTVCVVSNSYATQASASLVVGTAAGVVVLLAGVGVFLRIRKLPSTNDKYTLTLSADEEAKINMHDLSPIRIPFKEVVLGKLVASGAFADVWLGSYGGDAVAIKILHPNCISVAQLQSFVAEIQLMMQFDSPYIVQLVGACWTTPVNVQCVMEFMDGGDMRDYLACHRSEEISWAEKFAHIISIVEGLAYLHQMDVIHRDLKSKNIVLDSMKGTKLTDFGIAKEDAIQTMTLGVGTVRWMAPEVIYDKGYTVAADVYSFGIVLSEFDTHEIPYLHVLNAVNDQPMSDMNVSIQVATAGLRPTFSSNMPEWLRQIAVQCLAQNPDDRPTAYYLTQVIWTKSRTEPLAPKKL